MGDSHLNRGNFNVKRTYLYHWQELGKGPEVMTRIEAARFIKARRKSGEKIDRYLEVEGDEEDTGDAWIGFFFRRSCSMLLPIR